MVYRMKMLSIGINQYLNSAWNLNGCVPDVSLITQTLSPRYTKYPLDPNCHRFLVDNRATTDAMIERMKWVASDLMDGGLAVVHYSGHGSQVTDRSGDEINDHSDEVLCPTNMSFDGNYVLDDTIDTIFATINPNAKLLFIADCCHSGTIARDIGNPHPAPWKARFIAPPIDIAARSVGVEHVNRLANNGHGDKCILISGCRDNQTSADAYFYDRKSYHGALTWALCKVLQTAGPGITYRELVTQATRHVKEYGFSQDPQLSGPDAWLNEPFLACANV